MTNCSVCYNRDNEHGYLFLYKELVQMSLADDDELVDTSNHIIPAVQSHEHWISRLEDQQKQLKAHLDELTDQMLLELKTESTFF